eukprot:CAMPEP_0118684218 /NCGR_PEP_ID=MMETSP0800-20121206/6519_1 /TAXON_ID=210618 ORGANISM="Striatella unipunctata, Strain CCMP2910" /NCGR_SAMPLE_ID=MMETSP0800 /ASSEMBLY_ACC=CAM_ASM_000638 /LENGTH=65 /DNA_ID=CAMNT_0006580895 /DNA_START=487 /DNA_END=684 /DNA_ORIENTATION=+
MPVFERNDLISGPHFECGSILDSDSQELYWFCDTDSTLYFWPRSGRKHVSFGNFYFWIRNVSGDE